MKSLEVLDAVHVCGMEISNQFLLRVAAFSFLCFVVAEIVGALASNSLSLLGDAAAMSVDVFTVRIYASCKQTTSFNLASTYLLTLFVLCPFDSLMFQYFCNMYSEHVKAKYGEVDLTTQMVLEVGK